MQSRRDGGARFVGLQILFLSPDDQRSIEASLKAAFPNLRFLRFPVLVDWKATEADPAYHEARRVGRMDYPVVAAPESSRTFRYFEDMGGPDGKTGCCIWVEPPDWLPEWEIDRAGWPQLVNHPAQSFYFTPSQVHVGRRDNMAGPAPQGRMDNEHLTLIEGKFEGVYYPWERAKLSFLRRVRQIFVKHTRNAYCTVEAETLRPRLVEKKGSWNRIGQHAAAWAMEHPRHFLGRDFIKPIEWAEKYPDGWRPD